jgi:hypothetical protein
MMVATSCRLTPAAAPVPVEGNRDELAPAEDLQSEACTTIALTVVRVEQGGVRGTMAPYWDPDCDCRAQTVFEGKISGNRITGSFSSRRESSDRRLLTGEWRVEREQS